MRDTRQPADRPIVNASRDYQDRIDRAETSYEKFRHTCDWLFAVSRRARAVDETIAQLKAMIADLERKATR